MSPIAKRVALAGVAEFPPAFHETEYVPKRSRVERSLVFWPIRESDDLLY